MAHIAFWKRALQIFQSGKIRLAQSTGEEDREFESEQSQIKEYEIDMCPYLAWHTDLMG